MKVSAGVSAGDADDTMKVPAGVSAGDADGTEDGDVDDTRARKASMLGDIHTKPLPGAAFLKFRRLILNLDDGGPEMEAPNLLPLAHRSVLDKVVTWAQVS
jgi:hypothetical protein